MIRDLGHWLWYLNVQYQRGIGIDKNWSKTDKNPRVSAEEDIKTTQLQ